MKIKNLSILTGFAALAFTANALLPKTELQPRWLRVTDVERTDSATRVGIRLQNIPNYWVRFSSSARLIADGDTTLQYRLIGTENIDLDKEIWMPASCRHEDVLLFEKVPETVNVVDMVETSIDDVQNNVIGMHLDEAETRTRPAILTMAGILNSSQKTLTLGQALNQQDILTFLSTTKTAKPISRVKSQTTHPAAVSQQFPLRSMMTSEEHQRLT